MFHYSECSIFYCNAECHYAECHFVECCGTMAVSIVQFLVSHFFVMLTEHHIFVVMPGVIVPSAIMLNVVALRHSKMPLRIVGVFETPSIVVYSGSHFIVQMLAAKYNSTSHCLGVHER